MNTNCTQETQQNTLPIFITSAVRAWGAEHSMATIISGLSQMGVKSRVICSSSAVASFLNEMTDAEVITFNAPSNKFRRLLSFAKQTLEHRRGGTAVVVFSVNLYFLGWILRLVPGWRPKILADVHDSFTSSKTMRTIAVAMAGYNRVIYISNYVGTMLPARRDRRLVVRPISVTRRSEPKEKSDHVIVGIAGRLDAEKRIELAIEAVAMCGNNVSLNIYGDSFSNQADYRASLVKLGEQQLGDRVHFMGTVPPSAIYDDVDILLVANSQEASGRTVGEAMAAGVPVVVPSQGGAQEFVDHMVSGIVYQADSAQSAAEAIAMLATSPSLRSKFSEEGAAKIQSERSVLTVANLYLRAITD